jgi:hypothetical protein
MTEPGNQLALQAEAEEIVRGLLEKQAPLIDKFLAALAPESVREVSELLSISVRTDSGGEASDEAEIGPEARAAIFEAITRHVEPMIDEVLDELELELDEDEEIDEDVIEDIIGQLVDSYLNEIRSLLEL